MMRPRNTNPRPKTRTERRGSTTNPTPDTDSPKSGPRTQIYPNQGIPNMKFPMKLLLLAWQAY